MAKCKRVLLLLVVAATTTAASLAPTDKSGPVEQNPGTSTKHENRSRATQGAPNEPRTIIKESPPDVGQTKSRPRENDTGNELRKGWDKFWATPEYVFSAAVALFTAALFGVGWWQGCQLRRTVKAMQASNRIAADAERPWIAVFQIDPTIVPTAGQKMGAHIVLVNSGRGPAINFYIKTRVGILPTIPAPPLDFSEGLGHGPHVVSPGHRFKLMEQFSKPLSKEDVNDLAVDKCVFLVGVHLTYTDMFNVSHTYTTSVVYVPLTKMFSILPGFSYAD